MSLDAQPKPLTQSTSTEPIGWTDADATAARAGERTGTAAATATKLGGYSIGNGGGRYQTGHRTQFLDLLDGHPHVAAVARLSQGRRRQHDAGNAIGEGDTDRNVYRRNPARERGKVGEGKVCEGKSACDSQYAAARGARVRAP